MNEHPDIRARLGKGKDKSSTRPDAEEAGPSQTDVPADSPPPYDPNDAPRRHSFNGKDKQSSDDLRPAQMPMPVAGPSQESHKRGFFGKLKDKAIGTKEEREEAKRQEALVSTLILPCKWPELNMLAADATSCRREAAHD